MKIATHLLFALVYIANVSHAAAMVTTGSIDLGSDHEYEREAAVLRLGSKEEAPVSDREMIDVIPFPSPSYLDAFCYSFIVLIHPLTATAPQ